MICIQCVHINCGILRRRWFTIIIHRGHLAWCFFLFHTCVCMFLREEYVSLSDSLNPSRGILATLRLGFSSWSLLTSLFIVREYCITSNTYHHSPSYAFASSYCESSSLLFNFSKHPQKIVLLYPPYRQYGRYR